MKMKKQTKKSKKSASVVPTEYREHYKHDSCGDEVANALKAAFGSGEEFDLKGLTQCLKDNDCKVPAVDMKGNGAVGRFRMCAGIALRAALKQNGNLVILGKDLKSAHVIGKKTRKTKTAKTATRKVA